MNVANKMGDVLPFFFFIWKMPVYQEAVGEDGLIKG